MEAHDFMSSSATKPDAPTPTVAPPAPTPVTPTDTLVDKWWADHITVFQSNNWALMVEAKEDLKKRLK